MRHVVLRGVAVLDFAVLHACFALRCVDSCFVVSLQAILVLCEAMIPKTHEAIPTNTRRAAKATFDKPEFEPWFRIEQEYILMKTDGIRPFGFLDGGGFPGPYYCGATVNFVVQLPMHAAKLACMLVSRLQASMPR